MFATVDPLAEDWNMVPVGCPGGDSFHGGSQTISFINSFDFDRVDGFVYLPDMKSSHDKQLSHGAPLRFVFQKGFQPQHCGWRSPACSG
jgi:hypothetical protein